MSAAVGLFHAFVLHRRDYGNTSLLLEVFGRGEGRFPALAKGARRPRNPAGALLQPFQPLWLAAVGRGEVRTLTRIEGAGQPLPLQGRPLLCGFYVNELLLRLLGRNDPHDRLFAFYQDTLRRLGEPAELETWLRQFELRLLEELGYAVTLDREAEGREPVRPDGFYLFEAERGVRRASGSQSGQVVSGATLLALAQGTPLGPAQAREARRLLRQVLAPYLGEGALESRELYRRWYGSRIGTDSRDPPQEQRRNGPGPASRIDSTSMKG